MIDPNAKVDLRAIARKKMAEKKWSQKELAFLLGLTQQTICDWFHCRCDLSQERIERLLQVIEAKFE